MDTTPKQQTHNFESSAHMRAYTQTIDFQKGDSKKVDATKCRLFKNNNTVIFV